MLACFCCWQHYIAVLQLIFVGSFQVASPVLYSVEVTVVPFLCFAIITFSFECLVVLRLRLLIVNRCGTSDFLSILSLQRLNLVNSFSIHMRVVFSFYKFCIILISFLIKSSLHRICNNSLCCNMSNAFT